MAFNTKSYTTNSSAFISFLFILLSMQSAAYAQCTAVSDPAKLAELRQDAEAFGKQGSVWLMTKGGFPMRCEAKGENAQVCQTSTKGSAVSFLKGKLVSGVEFDGSSTVEFSFDETGNVECLAGENLVSAPAKEKEEPVEACEILSDTITMYKLLEESELLLKFGEASLMLHSGNPKCTADGNSVTCVTADKAKLVLNAPGAPIKAIQANGLEAVEMSFYDSGDLGCGTVRELERYRN